MDLPTYIDLKRFEKKYDKIGHVPGKPASSGYIYSGDIPGNFNISHRLNPISKQTLREVFKLIWNPKFQKV